MREVISRVGGVSEVIHWHADGETFTIEQVMDAAPILDANKSAQTHNPDGMGKTREWKHLAEIPIVVVFEWIRRYGVDPTDGRHPDLLRRLLNDPDWRWLRASEGRV